MIQGQKICRCLRKGTLDHHCPRKGGARLRPGCLKPADGHRPAKPITQWPGERPLDNQKRFIPCSLWRPISHVGCTPKRLNDRLLCLPTSGSRTFVDLMQKWLGSGLIRHSLWFVESTFQFPKITCAKYLKYIDYSQKYFTVSRRSVA